MLLVSVLEVEVGVTVVVTMTVTVEMTVLQPLGGLWAKTALRGVELVCQVLFMLAERRLHTWQETRMWHIGATF